MFTKWWQKCLEKCWIPKHSFYSDLPPKSYPFRPILHEFHTLFTLRTYSILNCEKRPFLREFLNEPDTPLDIRVPLGDNVCARKYYVCMFPMKRIKKANVFCRCSKSVLRAQEILNTCETHHVFKFDRFRASVERIGPTNFIDTGWWM